MFESDFQTNREETSFEEMRRRAVEARKAAMQAIPVEPLAPENASHLADVVLGQIEEEEKQAQSLSEVELRLEKANCYKALLLNPLFDSESITHISEEVENEIRGFIQKRLRILMGVEQEAEAAGHFSKEEITALKHLASRIMQKAPNAPPTVAKATIDTKPPPRVNRAKMETPAVERTPAPVQQMEPAPSKVKPARKKKEEGEVEITLPTGQIVKTKNERQAGMKPRSIQDLQEIADAAQAKAMAEVQAASENPLINKILG